MEIVISILKSGVPQGLQQQGKVPPPGRPHDQKPVRNRPQAQSAEGKEFEEAQPQLAQVKAIHPVDEYREQGNERK